MTTHVSPNKHVLIAGPTASGKSSLALRIAQAQGGIVVNADALQVYEGWRILTARPSQEDEALAPHRLYGHVPRDRPYSVGDWIRDVTPLLTQRLIIVGGTGLYFTALTEGLADIPDIPNEIRSHADTLALEQMLADLDQVTRQKIDQANRVRVQRAWEVQKATGRSLLEWQQVVAHPTLEMKDCTALLLRAPKDWLTPRIEARFDQMLDHGVLSEAAMALPTWNPNDPSSKAIGAKELISHLQNGLALKDVRDAIVIATRQYAKRQRTWFNKRMGNWAQIDVSSTDLSTALRL